MKSAAFLCRHPHTVHMLSAYLPPESQLPACMVAIPKASPNAGCQLSRFLQYISATGAGMSSNNPILTIVFPGAREVNEVIGLFPSVSFFNAMHSPSTVSTELSLQWCPAVSKIVVPCLLIAFWILDFDLIVICNKHTCPECSGLSFACCTMTVHC